MRMKMPDQNIGSSSSNSGYSTNGNFSDNYDSDPDGYITPPNDDSSAGGPNYDEDFSEYLWMEHEEEFERQEMQRLEEEALMEHCYEVMLQDELDAQESEDQEQLAALNESTNSKDSSKDLCIELSTLQVNNNRKVNVETSTLNPLAAEFVPSIVPLTTP